MDILFLCLVCISLREQVREPVRERAAQVEQVVPAALRQVEQPGLLPLAALQLQRLRQLPLLWRPARQRLSLLYRAEP